MKFIKKIAIYISFVISLFSIVTSALLFTHTTDYKLEKLSYNICNYNKVSYDNLNSSILSISFNDHSKNYKDYYVLNNKFYENNFIKSSRFISNDYYEITEANESSSSYKVHFISQSVFSKYQKGQNTYVLDYAQYALYNTFEFKYSKGMDFCFVSESIAKQLLMKKGYNITDENKIDYYNSLCASSNNEGTLFTYHAPDGKKFNLCVLGVLKSNYGIAYASTKKSIGDENFILSWLPFKYPSYFDFSYEIDLKLNPYGNKDTLKFCMNNYFDELNYKIQIKQYNEESGYKVNNSLTNEYYNIFYTRNTNNTFYYVALLTILICFVLFFIFNLISFKFNNKSISIVLVSYLILFACYGVLANFIFVYPLTTLVFLVYAINYLFLGRNQLYEFVNKIVAKIKAKFIK